VALVLLAHGLLLAGLPAGWSAAPRSAVPAMQVRQIARVAPLPVDAPAPDEASAATPDAAAATAVPQAAPVPPRIAPRLALRPTPRPAPRPAARRAPTPAPWPALAAVTPPPALVEAEADLPPPRAPEAAVALVPVALVAQAAATATAGTADAPPPTYPTKVPPAAALRYELRRGALRGEGEVHWRPEGRHYELQIEGGVLGLSLLSQTSSGGFDAAGLAPQRFVERRRAREQRAANFQRDRGVISFSATSDEFPLLPGAQDRLSWMLQLAAIVEAAPARHGAGDRIAMQVTGVRGDVDVWSFGVVGRETVEVAGGTRVDDALALRREPRKPYDTRVEVWLDPKRHHLPVRIKLASANGNDALELLLQP